MSKRNRLKASNIFAIWQLAKFKKLKYITIAKETGVSYYSVVGTAQRLEKYIYSSNLVLKKNKEFLKAANMAHQYLFEINKSKTEVEEKSSFISMFLNRLFNQKAL